MIDIQTSQQLWCAEGHYPPDTWVRLLQQREAPGTWVNEHREPVKLSWKHLYRYALTGKSLNVHDIRSNAFLHKITTIDINHGRNEVMNLEFRVCRLAGREALMVPDHSPGLSRIHFLDAERGVLLRTLCLDVPSGFHRVVPCTSRGELAFPLCTYTDPWATMEIRKFVAEKSESADGHPGVHRFEFVQVGTQACNMRQMTDITQNISRGPFRNFGIAVQMPRPVWLRVAPWRRRDPAFMPIG
ncbi:hypothetical protein BDW74DRAFT_178058 [Aspergillus multicolor]|uniref:uncharacterized protein n=1 Tax=Aspergillus multicolor TaxID=41759 RepID=UPI003CCD54BF